jgi:Flp pilus assembly protein TadD
MGGFSTGPDGLPEGEAYMRFQEGSRLLDAGNTHAAVVALERARELEPEKGSIREALARAYFRTQRIDAARVEFEKVLELDPVNDYAHFGLGMCLLRSGDRDGARGHLKMATIMRPDDEHYQRALRQASA